MAGSVEELDAVARLIAPPGPTPRKAVVMGRFRAYVKKYYGSGENLPPMLSELKRPPRENRIRNRHAARRSIMK